jgi:hypothetical protein
MQDAFFSFFQLRFLVGSGRPYPSQARMSAEWRLYLMKQREAVFLVAAWLAIAAGCGASPTATKAVGDVDPITLCEEPRPEVCTMNYLPVCGALEGGGTKTYSNACVACSDRAATGYHEDACAAQGSQDAPQGPEEPG